MWSVSASTISKWVRKFNIPTGGRGAGDPHKVPIRTGNRGYVRVQEESFGEMNRFQLHRLIAVAEYGYDVVVENDIHHKNEIKWDNRPSNLEPIEKERHGRRHANEQHKANS